MPHIGLIGLGLLGGALAARLSERGFEILGFDVAPERVALLRTHATAAASSQEVFDSCSRVVLCLPNSGVVGEVLSGNRLAPGTTILDTTTGDPDEMAAFGRELSQRGVQYIDTCVAGSSAEAQRGEVLVLAGGEADSVEACRDLLSAFSRAVFHVGTCGSGARMKLVVNLVLGLNRAVLAEGLAFAAASGLDPERALEVLRSGPARSHVMETKGARMLQRDFAPVARLSQHLKDVRLILEQAAHWGAAVPLSTLHATLLESLVQAGHGDEDNAAVCRAFFPQP